MLLLLFLLYHHRIVRNGTLGSLIDSRLAAEEGGRNLQAFRPRVERELRTDEECFFFFFLFSLLSWRRPFSYLLLLCDDGVGSLIDAASVLSTRGMFYPLVACHRFSSLLRSIAAAAAAATATTFPCTHKSTRPRARHQ